MDITPDHDDPNLPVDQLNAFDYATNPNYPLVRCPFAAHTRKMRPRSDDKSHDAHAILRRGIAYGDEVTDEEHSTQKTDMENGDRGILFVGYQSDLFQGFRTLQSSKLSPSFSSTLKLTKLTIDPLLEWANNQHFPIAKQTITGTGGPGLDPIIGQNAKTNVPHDISLASGARYDHAPRLPLEQWVIPRGGDYFFSPSIKELGNVA